MQKLRTERGITLIALIITIIVMLILVGVTVSVSLNGGLFTTAKQATNKTQIEIDKEQLLELALGAMNNKGKIVIGDLDTAVAADERFTGTGGTYTSVKSGKTYTVNNWGSVTEAPVYELSGKWKFEYSPECEGIDLNQNITFSVTIFIPWLEEPVYETHSFSNISVGVYDDPYDGSYLPTYSIAYDDWPYFNYNNHWHSVENGDDWDIVNFGSTPQPVSKEFYDWFTANANPVEE